MRASDWPAVEAIFAEGIATRAATFETEPPDYDSFDASHHAEHRLVAVENDRVVGLGRARSDVIARVLRRSRRELRLHRGRRAWSWNRSRAHGGPGGERLRRWNLDHPRRHVSRRMPRASCSTRASDSVSSAASSASRSSTASGATPSCSSSGSSIDRRSLRIATAKRAPSGILADYSSQRRNTTHALCPPKPKELLTPMSISCARASLGM